MPRLMGLLLNNLAFQGAQGGGWQTVDPPDGWTWELPFAIQTDGSTFRPDPSWDISAQVSRAGGERYVSKSGNDTTGDGLSWETAWASVSKANTVLGATPDVCVYVGEGIYGWIDGGFTNITLGVNRSFVGVGDVEIDSYFIQNPYSLVEGKDYTYQSPCTIPLVAVLDYGHREEDGTPSTYTKKASVDEVEATAGSFFYDGEAGILYVHTLDSAAPDTNVRAQYDGSSFLKATAPGVNLYAENFKVYYHRTDSSSSGGNVFLKNVHFRYRGMRFSNGVTAFVQDCTWRSTLKIGESTQEDLLYALAAKVCEIDCEGSYCGGSLATISNATTNHAAGENVIINGEYHHTYGPPIGFINDGKCWLLGTYAHDNLATSSNYYSYQLDEAVAYLDNCRSSGSVKDIGPSSATVHIRNFQGESTSDATLVEY